MNKAKLMLLASAAALLLGSPDASARMNFYAGSTPTLCMPQRTVAAGQALSPYAVATRLSAKRYKVQSMHRHGSAYAVRAIGPHGNKVDMMVDGGSGAIIGLTVLAAAAGNVISALTSPTAVYVDDLHPFGAVVPEVVYDSWDNINESSWEVASAQTIAVQESYAAYQAAVPFNFVHMARNGHSVALAPPKYHGFRLTNSRGQAIHSRMTRSEAASQEAAYQSERVDQAEFDKQMAQEDAADANEQADQLQQQNDALSDELDAQTQHADEVEQQNAALQQQLDQNGTANQEVDEAEVEGGDNDCGPSESTCNGQPNSNYDASDQGGSAETSDNGGTDQTDTAAPTDQGGEQQAAPAEPAAPPPEAAAPEDQGGADQQQQEQAAPQQEEAAPQDQGGNDQQTDQGGGGDDQQMDQGGGGDDQGGGGGDDSGGGGGDDSGGGGDDGN